MGKRTEDTSRRDERNRRYARHRQTLIKVMESHLKEVERERYPQPIETAEASGSDRSLRVGIVGGGMAGLYAAMLLDELGIEYQIFEASAERLGGRVRTHYFNDRPHQYAEMGPMRFPKSWLQTRLFGFWDYLNETAPSTSGAEEIVRIPYILFDQPEDNPKAGNLLCYNGKPPVTLGKASHKNGNSLLGFDPFFDEPRYDYFKDPEGKLKPAGTLLDNALEPFMTLLDSGDVDEAWEQILRFNGYSARSYLQAVGDQVEPYPVRIVDYIESTLSYSGVFDLSFIEILLDTFSFDHAESWWTMDGGVSRITREMANRVPQERVTMGAKVHALTEEGDRSVIHYRTADGDRGESAEFDRVIVTLPFPVLRFLDTPKSWSAKKYEAIRLLKMINAVKVALGFESRFWEREGPHSAGMKGGQSNTDLPVRSVVYPSFGIGEPGPAYLLASYCWQDDADKFTHLDEEEMFEVCLEHLVTLHGDVVRDEYLGHGTSIVWNEDPLSGGGFEFFAPGQFLEKFIDAREPEGRFHFAGEHLDMAHYWIAGSFDSAFRTVWEILLLENRLTPETFGRLRNALGGGLILPSMVPDFGHEEIRSLTRELEQNA